MSKPFYEQKTLFGSSEIIFARGRTKRKQTLFEYDEFVEKFKDKKTTDDCYTPKPVFDVILNYLKEKGKIRDGQTIIRPFFPGNDYQAVNYPPGCVVVDNPPFSIFTEIVRFYAKRNIPFFLFGPHLTLFGPRVQGVTYIVTGADIVYENGAKVKTSFVSNLFGSTLAFSDATLLDNLEALNVNPNPLPKYRYPDNLLTVSDMQYLLNKGVEFSIDRPEAVFVSRLDDQKKYGKAVFGGGLLISEAKAKAKAEDEANVIHFRLSPREQAIIDGLE